MNTKIFTALALITLGLLSWGLYAALIGAPTEATMGPVQRIFYYHVPCAWVMFLAIPANFLASVIYLFKRNAALDAFAVSTAEVGVVFCTIVLLTGPIWGKPAWGIWWTWDARLTSTLVLWLIYVSYLMLRKFSIGGPNPVLAASLAIFGCVDALFVWFAIRWFRTQHPQPVFGSGPNSGIDPRMLHAFFINLVAFTMLGILLVWLRYTLERVKQRVEEAHAMKALGGAR
ncbi:MAG TPA: cytochrome c biogenesis protein CcsA [Terriglobales bacterium]|nr:cytochrome c biogenesis protein CcsA [Terriglobales bacterium]